MIDKRWLIWGELCVGDTTVGYVRHDAKKNRWTLDAAGWTAACKAISAAGANTGAGGGGGGRGTKAGGAGGSGYCLVEWVAPPA